MEESIYLKSIIITSNALETSPSNLKECSTESTSTTANSSSESLDLIKSIAPSQSSDFPIIASPSPESLKSRLNETSDSNQSIRMRYGWNIHWKQPTFMICFALLGILLVIGHHIYYTTLNGTLASTLEKQKWPIRIGTMFSISAVACLCAAISEAYTQYIWNVMRRNSTSVETLDAMFSVSSNPFSFFDLEFNLSSFYVPMMALAIWAVKAASIAPPASLSVISAMQQKYTSSMVSTINWTRVAAPLQFGGSYIYPPLETIRRASLSAQTYSILPSYAPYINASYNVQFFGPTIQCDPPNPEQQEVFDFWSNGSLSSPASHARLVKQTNMIKDASEASRHQFLFSAFTWPDCVFTSACRTDNVSAPTRYGTLDPPPSLSTEEPLQIWVQTSVSEMVCSIMNATYDVSLRFKDGTQSTTIKSVIPLHKVLLRSFDSRPVTPPPDEECDIHSDVWGYAAIFGALQSLLNGNFTMVQRPFRNPHFYWTTSKILHTGLIGCEDLLHHGWENYEPLPISNFKELTGGEPWMCRNRTLNRAIEDLSRNITVSMLSNPDFLIPNSKLVNITMYSYENEYHYSPQYLWQSYGLAIMITTVSVAVGLLSLRSNGVSHCTSFSTVLRTTRNVKLDDLISQEGQDMGSEPLPGSLKSVKLRFGRLVDEGGIGGRENLHIGFGFESQIRELRRGESV